MIEVMRRWMLAGAVAAGSVGGLVALGIETAYWLGRLDPVVPHYLDTNVLRVWPAAGFLFYATFGGTGRAVVVLIAAILANAVLYGALGAVVGLVARAIHRLA